MLISKAELIVKPSSSDPQLIRVIAENILIAIDRIERRFADVGTPDDFLSSDAGIDRLDGITMMLIAIGEQLKQLDAFAVLLDLATRYPQVDWKGAKGIRDFLSHHYFSLDAEVIFDVCQNKLVGLKQAILSLHDSQVGEQIDTLLKDEDADG